MPKRTVKPRLSWPMAFAYAWVDLAEGKADVEDLYEKGLGLHRKNREKDPRKVAARDFARTAAPVDLIIGVNAPAWMRPGATPPREEASARASH